MTMTIHIPAPGIFHATLHSELGYMRAVSDGHHLIRLDWDQSPFAAPDRPDDVSRETCHQLAAYLAGERQTFTLPLRAAGISATGQSWLTAMARIPYGTTMSYTDFATFAGKPKAPRTAAHSLFDQPDTGNLSLPPSRALGREARQLWWREQPACTAPGQSWPQTGAD
jgi:alkylated DNA nucleotide flippase Atl1